MGRVRPIISDRRSRRFRSAAALAVMALVLAGCGQDAETTTTVTRLSSTTSTAAPAATSTEASTTTVTTTVPTTTVAPTTTAAPAAAATLAVGSDGLIFVDQATGSTTEMTFGSAQDEVVAAVDAALGETGVVGAANVECPNNQAATAKWTDIQLEFAPDGLIAWSLEPGASITDTTGVGMGASVADLIARGDVTIFESSLGTEFYTGDGEGIAGLLSDDSDSATVVSYWGGFICTFR